MWLIGDAFMPNMHLKQQKFVYSECAKSSNTKIIQK